MIRQWAGVLLLATVLYPQTASAMFEDEAGANDWHKHQLGTITSLHVASQGRLLAASDAAVIASINPADGSLVWRQVLDEKHAVRASLPVGSTGLLTLTGCGAEARLWNAETGNLVWDRATGGSSSSSEPSSSAPRVAAAASQDAGTVYTAVGSTVTAFAAAAGSVQWQWSAASDSALSSATGSDDQVCNTIQSS